MERENENENGRSRARDRVHSRLEACRLAAQLLVMFLEHARRRGHDVGVARTQIIRWRAALGSGMAAARRVVRANEIRSRERRVSREGRRAWLDCLSVVFFEEFRGREGALRSVLRARGGGGCVWRAPESMCGGGAGGRVWRGVVWRARSSLVSESAVAAGRRKVGSCTWVGLG
jgi:hypothetical protein